MPQKPYQLLLRWYDRHGRDLPWRRTRNPYRILVSEIMLQQTQVSRVLLFYRSWLKQFPTWKSLANASTTQVLHAWAGLGYNRRALTLQAIAKHMRAHGIPTSQAQWLELKGIGAYTAAAVSMFAQNERTLPVDTNIRRVIGRWMLGIPFAQPDADESIRQALERLLPKQGRYADIPQALFDLATNMCQKIPQCQVCPLRKQCKAAQSFLDRTVEVPKQTVSKPVERRHRDKPHPDRIYRGRILKLVREHAHVPILQIGHQIDPDFDQIVDEEWVTSMVMRMEKDGLLVRKKSVISLA